MKPKINVLEHELVPLHFVLSQEEKKRVLSQFKITKENQLPTIYKSDPVVQMLEAKPGDLIKIIRKSSTAKETVYYRLVKGE